MDELYESYGGRDSCHRLSTAFYARVARDPLLRPLFPKSFTCAIEEFAAFLAQFLAGPAEDTQRRWWLSLRDSHNRFKIGPKERAAWLRLMNDTLDEFDLPDAHRQALRTQFDQSSAYIAGESSNTKIRDPKLAARWDIQLALDQAVAAIRLNNGEQSIALARSKPLDAFFARDKTVHAHFLALHIRTTPYGDRLAYLTETLTADPSLAPIRHSRGRTLLNEAAGAGSPEIADLLLKLGADPNAGSHTPLYSAANECRNQPPERAARIVHLLAAAGADLNLRDPGQQTTPLHMAARQGTLAIAQALLDRGAEVDPRDSTGDTPLRRAVNCNRIEVARLLLAHNADPDSSGSQGLTPRTAASRNAKMRALFAAIRPSL